VWQAQKMVEGRAEERVKCSPIWQANVLENFGNFDIWHLLFLA